MDSLAHNGQQARRRQITVADTAPSARGFTLIELLVVISIIALLISILLPALRLARESAQQIRCASNQRQIAIATLAYVDDSGGYVLPVRFAEPGNTHYWYDDLNYYLGRQPGKDGRPNPGTWSESVFGCAANDNGANRISISVSRVFGYDMYVKYGTVWDYGFEHVKIPWSLSETGWYADIGMENIYWRNRATTGWPNIDFRHPGKTANAVFLDAHAETIQDPDFPTNPDAIDEPAWIKFFGVPQS